MDKYKDEVLNKCPIVYAMEIIGSKWKIPILWNLTQEDNLHYNELKRRIAGVTNTMLTRALRELEEAGLLVRKSAGTVPPSVTYQLTDLGRQLLPSLDGLYAWGEAYQKR
ncbi:helix-turn-helix domain-containing protein [uncultured Acidaminococcus sp.]|jgi:DNA-binding HxlR family transcriptional regulator|uniref:winged helix-turn-helix transcriptional regulator n=1 Tax=uncultured Acidaminococcus sp. TaxID=352152 RepID=UPI002598BB12|nr:helix-turn-helix domain-containing protein [uncultured Acidaminococcus sp.]